MSKSRLAAFSGGAALWANLHLLFWLSLLPFVTGWMGENHSAPLPTAFYGVVLPMAAIGYWVLQRTPIAGEGNDSVRKERSPGPALADGRRNFSERPEPEVTSHSPTPPSTPGPATC